MTNCLDLNNNEAKIYFLKDSSYHNFQLPDYFDFSDLLEKVYNEIKNYKNIKECFSKKPTDFDDVNYVLRHNKNWKYSWRKFELIHPFLYTALVALITEPENWKFLINRFNELKNISKVKCFSVPVVTEDLEYKKEKQIEIWISEIEKQSMSLSLDYKYLLNTDIVDCYWSIYTHSISRAIHDKEWSKWHRKFEDGIWNKIDHFIQYMHYWQTNWIPQWSILMDFIAEYVLLYIDTEFTKKLNESNIDQNYEILRYRDDYRIFVNNPKEWEIIIKILSEVLSDFWMRINTDKTKSSWNVIYDSMKIDKLNYMFNYKHKKNILQELIWIDKFSDEYPCSWSLLKLLNKVSKRIDKFPVNKDIKTHIAVLVDIGYKNPNTYNYISLILSKFLLFLDDESEKLELIKKISNKFHDRPNTEMLDLRLQRITYFIKPEIEYNWELYKTLLINKNNIWNNKRLKKDLSRIIEDTTIINQSILQDMNAVIKNEEIDLLRDY